MPEIVKLKPNAFYQISTDSGPVILNMPFHLSPEDAEHVIYMLELIAKQIRRRSQEWEVLGPQQAEQGKEEG